MLDQRISPEKARNAHPAGAAQHPSWLPWGFALLAPAGALLVRGMLDPILGPDAPLLVFTLAVLLASWYGGRGPGLLAILLSVLLGWFFFLVPAQSLATPNLRDMVRVFLFVLIGLVANELNEAWRTERRRAAESARALQESEERYRLLEENVREYAFIFLDPEGRITGWNPGAEAIMGYSEAEMLGKHISEIFTSEDRAAGAPEQEKLLPRKGRRRLREGLSRNPFWSFGGMVNPADRRDEAVAVLGNRLDEARTGRIVAELLPECPDALCESLVSDGHASPDLPEEAVLGDELALLAHQ